MSTPWVIAFCLLCAVVVVLAGVVSALAWRVTALLSALYDKLSLFELFSNGPAAPTALLGAPAPSLTDTRSLNTGPKEPGVARLVLFVDEDCAACHALLADLQSRPVHDDGVDLVLVHSGASADVEVPHWQVLHDPERVTKQAWQVTATPVAVMVDHAGVIANTQLVNTAAEISALFATGHHRKSQVAAGSE